MPRPRSKSKRWDHPNFRWAYCYERDGMVYTSVYGHRLSTGLAWVPSSRDFAMKMLTARVKYALSLEGDRPKLTIHEAIREYLEQKRMQISIENMRAMKLALSHIPNCDWFDSNIIRKTILQKVEGLSNWTAASRIAYIRSFFDWCCENEYLKKNPILKNLTPQKKRNENRSAFTESEMTAILDYSKIHNPKLWELLNFLAKTGLRISEALSLTSADIDDEYIRVVGKGQYIRYIPYRAIDFDDIELYRQKKGKLFKTQRTVWQDGFTQLRTELGMTIGIRSFHSIRKYFENKLIKEKNIEPRIVAELLGHTLQIQQKHYYEIMSKNELKGSLERARIVQNP